MSLPRATGLLKQMARTVMRWDDARRTRAALGRLSQRELWDIGLERGDLDMGELTRRH